jgi:DNA repair exonuclease SbcCD ATPase subunit
MKRILRRFKYVRDLEEELEQEKRALESACRYMDQLEAFKKDQFERMHRIEEELKGEQDRAVKALESCARLTRENDSLRRRLNKTGDSHD